jgi:hypothetical protein
MEEDDVKQDELALEVIKLQALLRPWLDDGERQQILIKAIALVETTGVTIAALQPELQALVLIRLFDAYSAFAKPELGNFAKSFAMAKAMSAKQGKTEH